MFFNNSRVLTVTSTNYWSPIPIPPLWKWPNTKEQKNDKHIQRYLHLSDLIETKDPFISFILIILLLLASEALALLSSSSTTTRPLLLRSNGCEEPTPKVSPEADALRSGMQSGPITLTSPDPDPDPCDKNGEIWPYGCC